MDPTTDIEADFESVVQSLNQEDRARGCMLWPWCQKATEHLFRVDAGGQSVVTAVGVRLLRSMVTLLVEHGDQLVPPMLEWLKNQVAPSLNTGGHPDLTYALLDALLHHMLRPTTKSKRVGKKRRT